MENTRLFKQPSIARFFYLSANTTTGVLIYPEQGLRLKRRNMPDFVRFN